MDPITSPSIWFIVVTTLGGLVTLWINSKVTELKKANEACEKAAKASDARVKECEEKHLKVALQNANQEGRIAALERLIPVIQTVIPAVPPKG